MAIERERRFLVDADKLPSQVFLANYLDIETGYFTETDPAIRVSNRVSPNGGKSKICIKAGKGEVREEFEFTIPEADAIRLIEIAPTNLKKTRFEFEGWEVDRFEIEGLPFWIAEYEEAEGKPKLDMLNLPPWITTEITDDPNFTNQSIAWSCGRK